LGGPCLFLLSWASLRRVDGTYGIRRQQGLGNGALWI